MNQTWTRDADRLHEPAAIHLCAGKAEQGGAARGSHARRGLHARHRHRLRPLQIGGAGGRGWGARGERLEAGQKTREKERAGVSFDRLKKARIRAGGVCWWVGRKGARGLGAKPGRRRTLARRGGGSERRGRGRKPGRRRADPSPLRRQPQSSSLLSRTYTRLYVSPEQIMPGAQVPGPAVHASAGERMKWGCWWCGEFARGCNLPA